MPKMVWLGTHILQSPPISVDLHGLTQIEFSYKNNTIQLLTQIECHIILNIYMVCLIKESETFVVPEV